MRNSIIAAAVSFSLLGFSCARAAEADNRQAVDIPAQNLRLALQTLSKDRDLQFIFRPDIVGSVETQPVSGDLTVTETLTKLLSGTSLTFKYLDAKTVTILPLAQSPQAAATAPNEADRLLVSQADASNRQSSAPPKSAAAEQTIDEVIVTAQKREERLQDVPVPVTAISAMTLVDTNQVRLQDYYTSVPGLSLATDGFRAGIPTLSIRGITTGGYGNPTVGITIDDVPYGSSTLQGGGIYAPDVDPSDLARVEVLRGPQGTLYGASSMGGLLKFVTVDPSTQAVSGRVQADLNSIRHGDGAGYGLRAAVNVPLGDTLAIRASGFARRDPGYIDNVQTGQKGINWSNAYGGRLSALWRPSDALSLKLSALYQDVTTHGSSEVDDLAGVGDLQQSVLRGMGGYNKKSEAYTATLNANLPAATLTAVTGYSINSLSGSDDYTSLLGGLTQTQFGVRGTTFVDSNKTSKFTQELRLSVPLGQRLDWLLGGYYDHESSKWDQNVFAENPATGETVGAWLFGAFPTTYREYAAFTDLTFHLNDRFDVQVGGRESHNKQTYSPTLRGPLVGGTIISPQEDSSAGAFTYLVTPRLKLSQDLMIYARFASGYRAGGPNTPGPGVPLEFKPDTTENYELGIKGGFPEQRITYDASLYYIDWRDIQLPLTKGINSYTDNGGRAKSQGIELSGTWRPTTGMALGAWVTWSDVKLTQTFPAGTTAYGVSGDRLPFSSRFSGHISLDQDFSVSAAVTGSVGAALSYVGDREGVFTGTATRQMYPAYAKADIHGRLNFDTWALTAYANNLLDRRALLSGGIGTTLPYAFNYIQPRTVGVTLSKDF